MSPIWLAESSISVAMRVMIDGRVTLYMVAATSRTATSYDTAIYSEMNLPSTIYIFHDVLPKQSFLPLLTHSNFILKQRNTAH